MKIVRCLPFLALCFLGAKFATAQITGQIPKKTTSKWSLKNTNGVNIPIDADAAGNFSIDITRLEKGIYTLDDVGELYLEPQYKLSISKSRDEYTFAGKGSVENNLIRESKIPLKKFESRSGYGLPMWAFLTEPTAFLAILENDEQHAVQVFDQSKNTFFKDIAKSDAQFIKKYKILNYMLFYGLDSTKTMALTKILTIPIAERQADHKKKLNEAYLAQFTKKFSAQEKEDLNAMLYDGWDMNNELLFKNSSSYRELINYRINFILKNPEYQKITDSLNDVYPVKLLLIDKQITNPFIHDYKYYDYTYELVKKSKDAAKIEVNYQQFMSKSNNTTYKREMELAYNTLKSTQKNIMSPEFNFANPQGEMVTLKSLRGKYVYIDIWATWCAPCIAEIPALKKLEDMYTGKKIEFVSISVDKSADKQVWLDFVSKNDLQGIQLMADQDFKSDFIKKFSVTAIPRFLLIAPDGSIVENDAKRPTDAVLKKQLDALLL